MSAAKRTAAAVGKFDGLHAGHMKLISALKERADEYNLDTVVFSFCPQPAEFFTGETVKGIYSRDEKRKMMKDAGVGRFIEYPFEKIKDMSPGEFVEKILRGEFLCGALVIGEGFRLGKGRSGGAGELSRVCRPLGISLVEVKNAESGGEAVSSSRIKKLLACGDIPGANELLGRAYSVSGEVRAGSGIGRGIGFPTANAGLPDDKFLPRDGVYRTVTLCDGGEYKSVTNIGTNPTVRENAGTGEKKCETHIIGLDKNIYGREIKINFYEFMRDEKKFGSLGELKKQIEADVYQVKKG